MFKPLNWEIITKKNFTNHEKRTRRLKLNIKLVFLTLQSKCEAVNSPSLETFKARLDGALSNLVYREVSLPIAEGLELDGLKGPFQPKPFHDSVTVRVQYASDLCVARI